MVTNEELKRLLDELVTHAKFEIQESLDGYPHSASKHAEQCEKYAAHIITQLEQLKKQNEEMRKQIAESEKESAGFVAAIMLSMGTDSVVLKQTALHSVPDYTLFIDENRETRERRVRLQLNEQPKPESEYVERCAHGIRWECRCFSCDRPGQK